MGECARLADTGGLHPLTAAIMQPYFFPYIGYFQLIHAVDKFVVYDDVNYIKRGWINRNRILEKGKSVYFTLETRGASQNKLINEVQVGENADKLVRTLKHNYSKAPFFQETISLVESLLRYEERNIARYVTHCLKGICDYLGIRTEILVSSRHTQKTDLKREQRLISICRELGCRRYINAIGGKKLYRHEDFLREGIELKFLKPLLITYPQFNNEFVPWLSIIDVLMFNSQTDVKNMLKQFVLVD